MLTKIILDLNKQIRIEAESSQMLFINGLLGSSRLGRCCTPCTINPMKKQNAHAKIGEICKRKRWPCRNYRFESSKQNLELLKKCLKSCTNTNCLFLNSINELVHITLGERDYWNTQFLTMVCSGTN